MHGVADGYNFVKNFGQPVELQLQSLYDYIITSFQAIAIIVDAMQDEEKFLVCYFFSLHLTSQQT